MLKTERTKIVATLGPASSNREVLGEMVEAGLDVVRLNFSHGERADHVARFDLVRTVASELGHTQGIVVDTHVRRLAQRLGLTKHDDPVKVERDLQKIVPREYWGVFPHLLIWHGRRVCLARRPRCETCVLNDLCPSSRVWSRR